MIPKETIEKWNKEFNALSVDEQKVAIAKDVIEQLNSNKYNPTPSTYCSIYNIEDDMNIQEHFDEVSCKCCALGAMFMSHVKFNNNFTIDQANNLAPSEMKRLLGDYFSIKELVLIETAFEQWSQNYYKENDWDEDLETTMVDDGVGCDIPLSDLDLTEEELDKAADFCEDNNAEERMRMIMQNIIDNKGEFVL